MLEDSEGEGFTSGQSHALRVLGTSISCISLICSTIVVICFVIFGELRKGTSNRLIFCMLLADLFSSLAGSLTPFNVVHHNVCITQAFLIQFFDVSAFIWTSLVAINAWLVTTRQYNMSTPVMVACHFIGWLLPFFVALFNYFADFYGQQDPGFPSWCWIQDRHVTARMVSYYGPLILLWAVTTVLYLALLARFRRSHTSSNHQSHTKARRMILSFLAAFIGCKVFALINRLQNALHPHHPVFVLMMLQAGTDPLRGFTDCAVYTFVKVRSKVRERLLTDTNLQSQNQQYKYNSII